MTSISTDNKRVYLGLCCINNTLRGKGNKGVFCSRSMIQKNFTIEKAQQYALQNIADITKLAKWNYEHNIFHLRLSSDILPHYTNPNVQSYDLSFATDAFREAGEALRRYKQRTTFHPGQFCVVGAHDETIFQKTVDDLKMHADMLDAMGIDQDGILCIHGGGLYGNKEETIQRWIRNFHRLPENVKSRLCIENCERCYSLEDCIRISDACNIPIILDSHHFECYNLIYTNNEDGDGNDNDDNDDNEEKKDVKTKMTKKKTTKKKDDKNPFTPLKIDDMIDRVVMSWTRRGMTPLFHISEQKQGARVGAHSDFIEKIPDYMMTVPQKYGVNLSIEVEAKAKEAAILHLYDLYPFLNAPY
jgi:UV DNA damage endonuclease